MNEKQEPIEKELEELKRGFLSNVADKLLMIWMSLSPFLLTWLLLSGVKLSATKGLLILISLLGTVMCAIIVWPKFLEFSDKNILEPILKIFWRWSQKQKNK